MSERPTEDEVLGALRQVKDPELGVNIVDLGLIYAINLAGDSVHIIMTMTSPGCPLSDLLEQQANIAVRRSFPGIRSVSVEIAWEPAWSPMMMSPAAKQQLGWAQ